MIRAKSGSAHLFSRAHLAPVPSCESEAEVSAVSPTDVAFNKFSYRLYLMCACGVAAQEDSTESVAQYFAAAPGMYTETLGSVISKNML